MEFHIPDLEEVEAANMRAAREAAQPRAPLPSAQRTAPAPPTSALHAVAHTLAAPQNAPGRPLHVAAPAAMSGPGPAQPAVRPLMPRPTAAPAAAPTLMMPPPRTAMAAPPPRGTSSGSMPRPAAAPVPAGPPVYVPPRPRSLPPGPATAAAAATAATAGGANGGAGSGGSSGGSSIPGTGGVKARQQQSSAAALASMVGLSEAVSSLMAPVLLTAQSTGAATAAAAASSAASSAAAAAGGRLELLAGFAASATDLHAVDAALVPPGTMQVNPAQAPPGKAPNPVLSYVRLVPYRFVKNLKPDYVCGNKTAVVWLSVQYHQRHQQYAKRRLAELYRETYQVRVLLVYVDIADCAESLRELSLLCDEYSFSMLCAWSLPEGARYLEALQAYEHKNGDALKERLEETYLPRAQEVLTTVKQITRPDVITLLGRFGSVAGVFKAGFADINKLAGFGDVRTKALYEACHTPFKGRASTTTTAGTSGAAARQMSITHFAGAASSSGGAGGAAASAGGAAAAADEGVQEEDEEGDDEEEGDATVPTLVAAAWKRSDEAYDDDAGDN